MKLVIDQNYFRRPELHQYLSEKKENEVVVTDMAIFEMLKGSDPILTAEKSLATISDFPDQVFCTAGTGDLMRRELTDKESIVNPIDEDLSQRMRSLLQGVREHKAGRRKDFPLDEAHIVSERATAISQRLDHSFHKKMLDGGVAVLRKELSSELLKDIRRGQLTQEVYQFAYKTGFIAFREAIKEYNLPEEDIKKLYFDYSLTARQTMVYQLSSMRWLEVGGAEAMVAADITNDLHDIDYVVASSYFDGILSREKRVNLLYGRMKDFFGANIKK